MPEPITFEVTPEVRERLTALRVGPGPVILNRSGAPYSAYGWAQAWRNIRDSLKLPKTIWAMDIRSGAITEGQSVGATAFDLSDAAGHKHVTTTDR